jgi:hypothetical protein
MDIYENITAKLKPSGQSSLLSLFDQKVEAARSKYMPNIKRLKKQSVADQETDKLIEEHDKKVKSLFEQKKAQVLAKIKKMQDKFGVKPQKKDLILKKTKSQIKRQQEEEVICAVTREKLSSDQTYSILANIHLTNVCSA